MRSGIPIGSRVGGFRIESLLGEGAMGAVYLAEEEGAGRRVALKLLAPELAHDDRFRARFLRETKLAAELEHPGIVPILAAGEDNGTLYLAMALIDGHDLRKLLRHEGRLTPDRATGLVDQVADALDAAHAHGLVHRDVKPGNILVSGERAYLCDFGLARHVSSVSSLTSERGFVGTIDYVPPEQIEGATVDARADVYSLGCVLFECLTGVRPFDRDSELSVLFAHLNDPPPRVTETAPELPAAFDTVIATALAKAPEERYGSCGDLARAARSALGGTIVRPRHRGRRRVLVAAVLGVAAVSAVVAAIVARSPHHSGAPATAAVRLRPSSLTMIAASTDRAVGRVDLGVNLPVADTSPRIAFTRRAAWVLLASQQRLVRVDLATRRRTRSIRLPWPAGITTTEDSVWLAQDGGPELWRLDASGGRVARVRLRHGGGEGALAYGAGSLWLASGPGIIRVDPRSGRIEHTFALAGTSGLSLVFADGAVWAARSGNGLVVEIDPASNRVVHATTLHGAVTDLAVGGGSVWVPIVPDGQVYRLSEDDLSVRGSTPAGRDPERVSLGRDDAWVTDGAGRRLVRIAQVSGARRSLRVTGGEPATGAYRDGLLWVVAAPVLPALAPIRGQELRVLGGGVPYDPVSAGLFGDQVLYATCAKLLNYPDARGRAGAELRPEIAAAPPTLSADGRTYTFRIRNGFRFSPPSNEPVTAATFKHTIEREIATSSSESRSLEYADDIVGARALHAGQAAQAAGIVARGNRLAITLIAPAGDFLTRLAMPRFCPVPRSTPLRGGGDRPLPSAGPYYVASSAGGRSVLLRNPNYHGSRPRRSARIVFDENVTEATAIALVDHGDADLIPASGAGDLLAPGGPVDRHAPGPRYHLYPGPLIDYVVFNTRRPLFRDLRLRRAVDAALDRRALAGAFADAPGDQVVPPAVVGYRAGRVFGLGPDVRAGRRLADGRRQRAVLYICGDPREAALAKIIGTDLARIGIGVSVTEDAHCPEPDGAPRTSNRADLLIVQGWPYTEADERDPAQAMEHTLDAGLFGAPVPSAGWDARSFRRRLAQTRRLRGAARSVALHHLATELTRTGPLAVFGSWEWPEYFSPGLGCVVFQSVYAVADLGALCRHR